MKPIYIYLIALLSCLTSSLQGQEKISIGQCYEWAQANYPQIHRYDLLKQAEQYQLVRIGKSWLPQLSVQAKASYQSDVTQLPFDQEKFTSLMPGTHLPTLSKDQYQVVAQLTQTLWDGGASRSSKALTQAETKARQKDLDSELYALNQRVNELYFGCLLQDELIEQNLLLQKELQTNIDRVQSLMKNGVANLSDVESIQVELLKAQQQAIQLKANRKAFRLMLEAFIGKPLSGTCQLERPAIRQPLSMSPANRPELRALEAREEILNSRDRQITSRLMPRFSTFVQGGFGRPALNKLCNDFEPFYVAGIRLSWDLGSFYTLKDDRRELQIGRKDLQVEKETFLFKTRLQLLQQDTEIQKMNDLIQADEDIIRLRNHIKQAAEVKLVHGVSSVSDLIREINAENQARQMASTHQIQLLMKMYERLHTTNQSDHQNLPL